MTLWRFGPKRLSPSLVVWQVRHALLNVSCPASVSAPLRAGSWGTAENPRSIRNMVQTNPDIAARGIRTSWRLDVRSRRFVPEIPDEMAGTSGAFGERQRVEATKVVQSMRRSRRQPMPAPVPNGTPSTAGPPPRIRQCPAPLLAIERDLT